MKIVLIQVLLIVFSINSYSQNTNDYLKVGEKAPVIVGIDQFGKTINSGQLLNKQKVLLVFYRGYWCPYCRKHLASLQENLESLKQNGVFVIVVTPEKGEKITGTSKDLEATFSIIHDKNNQIMDDFKVSFEVNKLNVHSYFGFTQKKIEEYNVEGNNILPVPATYLIDKSGKIIYVHYNPDYKERSDFEEILKMTR